MKVFAAILGMSLGTMALAGDSFGPGRYCHVAAEMVETRGLHDLFAPSYDLDVYVKVNDAEDDGLGLAYAKEKALSWLDERRWGIQSKTYDVKSCAERSQGCSDKLSGKRKRWCYEF